MKRFGRLVVVGNAPSDRHGKRRVRVRCSCGTEKVVGLSDMKRGRTTSCGCFHRERAAAVAAVTGRTHGMTNSSEFDVWSKMLQRCLNPNNPAYSRYGGRGIGVCERWRGSFELFLEDVGMRPSNEYSLDRFPNNNGNYEPGNVRWATAKQQARNRRNNRLISVKGETKTLAEWSERTGIHGATIRGRLSRGLSAEEALGL